MRLNLFILGLVLSFLGVSNLTAANADFQKIDATLVVNGKVKGVMLLDRQPGKDLFRFPGPLVLMALSDFMSKKSIAALEDRLNKFGFLTTDDLRRIGVVVEYSELKSQISLSFNAQENAKPAKEISVSPESHKGPELLAPSAYRRDTLAANLNDTLDLETVLNSSPVKAAASPSASANPVQVLEAPKASLAPVQVSKPPQAAGNPVMVAESTKVSTAPGKPTVEPATAVKIDSVPKSPIISTYSYPESKDALFKSIFKSQPPKLPVDMEVSLKVDEKMWGKVWIKLSPDRNEFYMSMDTLNLVLEEKLSIESLKKLRLCSDKDGLVSGKSILSQGIVPTLKVDQFELEILVPSQLMGTQKHNLSMNPNLLDESYYDLPAGFSGFLNTRFRQNLRYAELSPNATISKVFSQSILKGANENYRQPYDLDLDGAINFKGLVLESRAVYTEPQSFKDAYLRRDGLRLVYDQPKFTTRYFLGDLLFPTFGYQSFLQMGGIGASRDFSLQPNQIVYPTRQYEFYLENQAEVKVYVNGSLITTLILEPGAHNLEGIPLSTGESEIQIDIIDATGRTQNVKFKFIHEPTLLGKGRSSFSFNVGVASEANSLGENLNLDEGNLDFLGYRYAGDKISSAMAYQRGITEKITAATYAQTLDTRGLLGLNFINAFPVGRVNTDMAISLMDSLGYGFGINIGYSSSPKPGSLKKSIGWLMKAEYVGETFSRVKTSVIRSEEAFIFSGGLGTRLDDISVNVGGGYFINRHRRNIYNAALSMRRNLVKGLSANVNINHFFDQKDRANTTFTAVFQYFFSSGINNFSASQRFLTHQDPVQDTVLGASTMQSGTPRFDNTTDLSWDYNSSTPFPNNPKVTGLISLAPTYNDYSTRIGLRGNHGLLDVNMRRTEPGSGYGNFVQNQMEMIGQTSLVFVGANAGFSRPVQDGFLLAKGVKSLRNTEVSINKNEVGYDAQSTYLGPAVLPSLYSYSPKAIRVNAIDPPLGTTIEKTQYLLYPGYRSGFLVTVGTDGDVVAMGTIKDHVGKLLEYKVLKVHSIEDSKHPPTTAFTNAAGRFQFAGLKPGKWKLDVVDLGSTTFVIPKSAIGIFQLGELKMDPIR